MNHLQLYINDHLVDLSDDSPIALTFQINNLAEVKNQQGNTSNQFKLPLTQRNRQILGFPDDVPFTTNAPYDNYQAKIIQDGLEIVAYGIAVLNGVEQDSAAITVLSGNVDFFDSIDGKIYDMGDKSTAFGKSKPFEKFNHKWTVANVVQSQNETEGWIWPVVDYGNLAYNVAGDNEINIRYLRPGFFIKTAIDVMVSNAGYKAVGSLLKNTLYPRLIAQFSNDTFEHGSDYQNQPDINGCRVFNGADIVISRIRNSGLQPGGELSFSQIDSDVSHRYIGNRYHAEEIVTVDITLDIPKFYFYGRVTGSDKSDVHVSIVLDSPGLPRQSLADKVFDFSDGYDERKPGTKGSTTEGYKLYYKTIVSATEVNLAIGDELLVTYDFHGAAPYNFTIFAGATFSVAAHNKTMLPGQEVQCERIFPDISQKDLLKDVLQRFGIICQTDNTSRTINFATLKDVINNIAIAKNWTAKCLDQGKAITFQLGGYAQVNYLKHKDDDAITPKGFGNTQINVADNTLAPTADIFESQFAPTFNRPYIGGFAAQIRKIDSNDDSDDFTISTAPRLLVDNKVDLRKLNNRTIKFTDGNAANDLHVNDVVSLPYFYRPDGDFNLCFADMPSLGTTKPLAGIKSNYYPELEKILHQTKKVVRYFMLTPRDILELDLLIPVYLEQDSAYYYINKIDSWRKGQPVKVELVKLG